MTTPNELSVIEAARAIRAGSLTSEALVESCLARIDAREAEVKAWVEVDRDGALAAARALDEEARAQHWHGPLHGIPVGIKDIFDVEGLPTRAGTDSWPEHTPDHDAASVARLRHAGAIILGKTVTTSYAMGDPGPTTNPWNAAHTPGGSSSGSAAAVADRMCLVALGTQTAGSVIRPCSYNGLAGIKPGHGRIDVRGVLALSWRLDHVGVLARDVADTNVLWQVLRDDEDWRDISDIDEMLPEKDPARPLRLWRLRGLFDEHATPEMAKLMDEHCDALASRRISIIERDMPKSVDKMLDYHRVVMASEAAAAHTENFAKNGAHYPPRIKELIEEGQRVDAQEYIAARQHRRALAVEFAAQMLDVDGAISPAAVGSAPAGLDYTGDRTFNALSSYIGLPVVTYPVALDSSGLPMGMQIMGRPTREDELLSVTRWCENFAAFQERP